MIQGDITMKKLLIPILMILTIVAGAMAAVTVTETTFTVGSQAQGTTITHSLTVVNDAATAVTIDASALTFTSGSNTISNLPVTLSDTSIAASATETVVASYTIPSSATVASGYTGTLTVQETGTPTNKDTVSLTDLTVTSAGHEISVANGIKIDVSYDKLEKEDETVSITQSVTLKNTGAFDESSVVLSLKDVDSDVTLSLSDTSAFALNTGAEKIITITGTVPPKFDSGIHTIATLVATHGSITSEIPITIDVKSLVEITKIEVYVDGDKVDTVRDNGDKIDHKFSLGDEVYFIVHVENNFDSSFDEADFRDASVDFDINLDDSADDSQDVDIRAGKKEEVTLDSFVIDENEDEDTYEVDFTVIADTDNIEPGSKDFDHEHTASWKLDFEIDIAKNDVRITQLDVSNTQIVCNRDFDIDVEVKNKGSDDQNDVDFIIKSNGLGFFDIRESNLQLDQIGDRDDEFRETYRVSVGEDVTPGTYDVEMILLLDNRNEDKETVRMNVRECTIPTSTEVEPQPTPSLVIDSPPVVSDSVPELVETPFTESGAFIALLAIVVVVLLVGIFVVVFKFLI